LWHLGQDGRKTYRQGPGRAAGPSGRMDDGFAVTTDTDDLLRQAEAWHARLMAPDCSAAERAAFAAWCRLSPAHAQARASTDRLLAGVERLAASDARMQQLMRRARTPAAAT